MLRKKVEFTRPGIIKIFLVCLLIQVSIGCQRDDICSAATQTTPMLNIVFFDAEDPDLPKPPSNLIIREIHYDTIIHDRVNSSELRIPLRPDANTTRYEFILNAPVEGSPDESNSDLVLFTYDPREIYISRACSFKVNFMDLEAELESGDNWIQEISVEVENIENETQPHIIIYH
ncbi:hypothetical protein BH23BAC2_BH23BAC2_13080 [soil metagenome]